MKIEVQESEGGKNLFKIEEEEEDDSSRGDSHNKRSSANKYSQRQQKQTAHNSKGIFSTSNTKHTNQTVHTTQNVLETSDTGLLGQKGGKSQIGKQNKIMKVFFGGEGQPNISEEEERDFSESSERKRAQNNKFSNNNKKSAFSKTKVDDEELKRQNTPKKGRGIRKGERRSTVMLASILQGQKQASRVKLKELDKKMRKQIKDADPEKVVKI